MSFTPFDDTQTVVRAPRPTRNGYDTSAWDIYRQGVEIINDRFRFAGTQPKFWSGTTDGQVDIITYGQSQGSIEGNGLGLESKFQDYTVFNPVAYITLGVEYPLPVIFNDGPSQQEEAMIEPLAIPFRIHSNEGPSYAHAIRAEIEDGNNLDSHSVRSSSRMEQFIELAPPVTSRYFLDEGGGYFGNLLLDPYVAAVDRQITPFDDTLPYSAENRLSTTNVTIQRVIRDGQRLGNQNLLPYGKKSAPAGSSYYGRNAGEYGTDSMAFGGWALGS